MSVELSRLVLFLDSNKHSSRVFILGGNNRDKPCLDANLTVFFDKRSIEASRVSCKCVRDKLVACLDGGMRPFFVHRRVAVLSAWCSLFCCSEMKWWLVPVVCSFPMTGRFEFCSFAGISFGKEEKSRWTLQKHDFALFYFEIRKEKSVKFDSIRSKNVLRCEKKEKSLRSIGAQRKRVVNERN